MKSRDLFVEVFENYGYIEVEDASDGFYEEQGILPYEDWYEFGFEYIETDAKWNGFPIFRHQGPYSIVKKTIKERHYDDLDMVDEIMEGFVKL